MLSPKTTTSENGVWALAGMATAIATAHMRKKRNRFMEHLLRTAIDQTQQPWARRPGARAVSVRSAAELQRPRYFSLFDRVFPGPVLRGIGGRRFGRGTRPAY